MPYIEEKFDQERIDGIRRYLQRESDKGRKKDYEIIVDGFKIISRTNDVAEFDEYEAELKNDTQYLAILIYDGPNTNRNTKHCFLLRGEAGAANNLSGTGTGGRSKTPSQDELGQIMQEKLDARDKEYEITRLKEKLAETQKLLEESEDYTDILEQQVKDLESGQVKKMAGFGDIAGYLLDGYLKQNPHIIRKIPIAGETLAGLLNAPVSNNGQHAQNTSEETATFERKQPGDTASGDDKQWLQYRHQLQHCFNEQQVSSIFSIVDRLSREQDKIETVAQLLNI